MTSIVSDSLLGQPLRYPAGPLSSMPKTQNGIAVAVAALCFVIVLSVALFAGHIERRGATANIDTASILGKMNIDMSSGTPVLRNASRADIRSPEIMCMDKSTPAKSVYLFINRKISAGSTSGIDGLNLSGMTQPSCAVIDLTIAQ
jgi:hypothetical protein